MRTYSLQITEAHARTIMRALDFYMRIGLLQFDEMVDVFPHLEKVADARGTFSDRWDLKRAIKSTLNRFLAPEDFGPGTNYSIINPDIPDDIRVAADIHDVIRNRLAWDREPQGGFQRDFDKPSQRSAQPLAKIEEIPDVPSR